MAARLLSAQRRADGRQFFSWKSPDEKLEKAATDLSLVLRSLQEKRVNQCNGVGLNLLVGAVPVEKEGRGRLED